VGRYAVAQDGISDSLEHAAVRGGQARGHHEAGAALIAPYVPERVAFLVRAHTDAKRYLCATEPSYYETLSGGSKHTLTLQGGVMTPADVEGVARHPWWPDAARLRRWDDAAKVAGKQTRELGSWAPLVRKYFSHPRAVAR
jgi:predicted HD phosphohydrolase